MKYLILLFAVACTSFSITQAQNFVNTGSGINRIDIPDDGEKADSKAAAQPKVIYANPNSMDNITMESDKEKLHFENLPSSTMILHVTDANGNEVMRKKLSRTSNDFTIKKLGKGLHFVTVISENTNSRKSFTLNRN